MSSIYTEGGGFSFASSILHEQLHPEGKEMHQVLSKKSNKLQEIPRNTTVDLTRLGTLIVNGKTIYKDGGLPKNLSDEAKVAYVFNEIESKLDSTSRAIHASNLLYQKLKIETILVLNEAKGVTLANHPEAPYTHALGAKKLINVLTTDKENFTFVQEQLVENLSVANGDNAPKPPTYFKVKTVVSGRLTDLDAANETNMSVEMIYTKEYPTMKSAQNADYTDIVSSKQDPKKAKEARKSYIKG